VSWVHGGQAGWCMGRGVWEVSPDVFLFREVEVWVLNQLGGVGEDLRNLLFGDVGSKC